MNKSCTRLVVFSFLYCLPWSIPLQAASISGSGEAMFWENQLDDAMEHRNSVFSSLVNAPASLAITGWDSATRRNVEAILLADSSTELWHLLIYGIIQHIKGKDADGYLSQSLEYAVNDPGATWLLFTEFNRYHLASSAETALGQLEKQMFIAGARMVPLIYGQLMHYATIARLSGNDPDAHTFYRWAHRFNPYEHDSFIRRAALNGYSHPVETVKYLFDAGTVIASSWQSQLSFVHSLYSTIHIWLTVFLLITITVLCIKYLPLALHRTAHLFSETVPASLRTVLVSAILLSFISFGIIPLLWLILFIIWKHCSRIDRVFASLIMVLLLLTPVNSVIRNHFFHAFDADGHTTRFARALYEGYSASVAGSSAAEQPSEKLNDLSTILSTMKRQEWSRALAKLDMFPAANGDPFCENLRGICYFLLGSVEKAIPVFQQILITHPSDPSARFNLARCYIASNDATTGMELLNQAAQKHPELINGFIQDNDHYFSGTWPPLRQVLFPDYTPMRFWKEIFFGPIADSGRQRYYWGLSFLGIPPLVSFFLFLMLSAGILFSGRTSAGNRKLRRYFSCKYCGRVLCRRCTNGILCSVCATATRDGASSGTIEKTREHLVSSAKNRFSIRSMIFNLVIPGSGSLLELRPPRAGTIVTFLASVTVYTCWFGIIAWQSLYLMTTVEKAMLLVIPICFHCACIVSYIIGNKHAISSLFTQFSSEKG